MTYEHYLYALIPMAIAGILFWLISVFKKDVSIVDSLWSLYFVIATLYWYNLLEEPSLRSNIILILVLAWGLRLSLYITARHWGHEEDYRYQTIRKNNDPGFEYKSLYLIFGFQTIVAWIISIPLFYSLPADSSFTVLDYIGITLWLIGMYFEVVGDHQLWQFKRDKNNQGKILTSGLWRHTRHPNYFGEFLIWWGYFFITVNSGAYWTIVSPLLMSFILLKFSGVMHLEKTMKLRPGYEEYMENTNAFLPGFRRGDTRS